MAETRLFPRLHFREGAGFAIGNENGIVTEPARPSRFGYQPAVNTAFEEFPVSVRPEQAQNGNEACMMVRMFE